jgi:hypothetical protein
MTEKLYAELDFRVTVAARRYQGYPTRVIHIGQVMPPASSTKSSGPLGQGDHPVRFACRVLAKRLSIMIDERVDMRDQRANGLFALAADERRRGQIRRTESSPKVIAAQALQ